MSVRVSVLRVGIVGFFVGFGKQCFRAAIAWGCLHEFLDPFQILLGQPRGHMGIISGDYNTIATSSLYRLHGSSEKAHGFSPVGGRAECFS